jgi:hypothetical protein
MSLLMSTIKRKCVRIMLKPKLKVGDTVYSLYTVHTAAYDSSRVYNSDASVRSRPLVVEKFIRHDLVFCRDYEGIGHPCCIENLYTYEETVAQMLSGEILDEV